MDKRIVFSSALKDALKAKDAVRAATIRLILAALKDRDISARTQGKPDGIDDNEILSMLQTMIKQRQESAKIYADAGREDLAGREEAEIAIIHEFMPKQLGDNELEDIINDLIKETGASNIKDMGKVIGAFKTRYAGQADMGKASGLVKARLAS
jgi:uncharacterized protein YqeY